MENRLWYKQAAETWTNGLPIGTGRLAGMVLGTVQRERIGLNHEWLWRGENRNRDNRVVADRLAEVRELLLAGNYDQGTLKGDQAFGSYSDEKQPNRVDAYQPAGDLYFELAGQAEVTDYCRELNLDNGLVTVKYCLGGRQVTREYLASWSEDVLLVRITADGGVTGRFWLDRVADPGCFLRRGVNKNVLVMDGFFDRGIGFRVEAEVCTSGGTVTSTGDALDVRDAEEVIVVLDMGTTAKAKHAEYEMRSLGQGDIDWETILADHEQAYGPWYHRAVLRVATPEDNRPTDERLEAVKAGGEDAGLAWLFYNYGRYLLLAGTVCGELPLNLQGKWNEQVNPPWDCDYHHDVNLQMAYWPAEAGGLEPICGALFGHIERFASHGRKAAHDLYGCGGVYFPLQSDVWGRCTPESWGWAVWTGAAAWLAQHLWWHWEYGQDEDYLKERCYPFLREVAAFYQDYMIEDEAGVLQLVPSQSPENHFLPGNPFPVTLCVSATMDVLLVQEVLEHAITAAQRLGVDADKCAAWAAMLKKLPKLKIGKYGQLMEWQQDFNEEEPGHRHFSHLYGVYPGDLLDPQRTSELWQASWTSLERRLAHGGAGTGWSRAWTVCFMARFGKGEQAWEHLQELLRGSVTESLLDLHPPHIFQIDGNMGAMAGVQEMLLQSYREELHFLPALPQAWHTGEMTGLRGRGGYTVDMSWQEGRLVEALVSCSVDRDAVIRHGAGVYAVSELDGKPILSRCEGDRLIFSMKAGQEYRLFTKNNE